MPNNEEKLNAIINHFKNRYKAEVLIIVGSRAVGDFKPNSDWDIYMFTDADPYPDETFQEAIEAYPEMLKDEDIDLYWNTMDESTYTQKLWRDLRNSKVILDTKDGYGQKLRKKALELYEKGPKKWSKDYAFGRTIKARRYMKKFEDNLKEEKYEELFLRIAWHYSENIIDWWFGIRQEFPLRPQKAFPYIEKQDPIFYNQLQKIASSNTRYQEKIEAFRKIHQFLFQSDSFKNLIK